MSYMLESNILEQKGDNSKDNNKNFKNEEKFKNVGDVLWNLRDSVCGGIGGCEDSSVLSGIGLQSILRLNGMEYETLVSRGTENANMRASLALIGVHTINGEPIYDDGDSMCLYGNQLKSVPYALFTQRDLNKLSTATLITKDYDRKFNASWRVGTKMRGRTQFGKYSFPFPTQTSTREFVLFLTEMSALTRSERQTMYVDGIISSEKVASVYEKIFPRLRAEVYAMGMDDLFQGVEFLSTIILIFDSILKKDLRTLGLLFMQQAKTISLVAEYMGSNFSSFKEYCISMFDPDATTITLGVEVGDFADWMSVLPGYMKQSPLVQRTIKLASCLMSVHFIRDSSLWQYFLTLVSPDFTTISTTVFCSTLFYQVVTALWEGFKRMESFTDWKNLIGISKDAYFKENVQAIQLEKLGSCTEEEIHEKIKRIDDLIATRKGLMDSPDIERKINFLIERKILLYTSLEDYRPRKKPILIWLNGPPGTGKTTLTNALSDFLAKRDGFERKLGDTIIYNIHDKYPVEAAAHYDAKFVHINDIPSTYLNYQVEGKVPLDILLQMMIDTSPLTFQAAFRKGIIYNHIKYIFISSNHYNYAFSSETEKLQRRLDDSILLDIKFRSGNYAKAASVDILERNDCLRAVVLKAKCDHNKLGFGPTVAAYSFTEVFEYISRKVDDLTFTRDDEHSRFHAEVCTCGVAPAFHLKMKNYVCISESCDVTSFSENSEVHCKFGIHVANHVNGIAHCIDSCESLVTSVEEDILLGPDDVEEKVDIPHAPDTEVQGLFVTAMWYGSLGYTLMSLTPFLSPIKVFLWMCKLSLKAILFDFLVAVAFHLAYLGSIKDHEYLLRVMQIRWGLQAAILRIQLFIHKHKVPIAALGVATVVGFGVSHYKPKTRVQGANRLNYNAESLTTTVTKVEQTMETNARSWARVGPSKRLEIRTKNTSLSDLATLVRNNTHSAAFIPWNSEYGTAGAQGYLFSIDANRVLVNKHYMQSKVGDKYVLRDTIVFLNDGTNFKLMAADVVEHPLCEVVGVTCTHFRTAPNLSKFLLNGFPSEMSFDALYVADDKKVVVTTQKVTLPEYGTEYPALSATLSTAKGDCGNVLIGYHQGSAFLAGILFAGTPHLTGHVTHFSFIPIGAADAVRIVIPEPEDLEPLSVNSEGHNDPHENLIPLGTNPKEGREGFRGMLKESRLYEVLKGKLSEEYYFPKKIAGNVAQPGEAYQHGSAWKHTFKRFDLPNQAAHAHFMGAVVSYVFNFDGVKFPKLAPLTLAQAFFGEPDIGVDPFPMKTSTGPYWRRKGYSRKENLFTLNEETGEYHLIPEFRDAVQHGLDLLDEGVVVAPLVELVAKDEVRPVRKLDEYNVRLFSVLDVDYNIIVRMYMMPLVVFLLKEKKASECYGQMHAASRQWTELYEYLVEPGFSKFADMDFSAFDTCHDEKVFLAVSYVMMILAAECGYSQRDAQKVAFLVQSMGTQVCQYKGDYFLKTKGMPSGVILTLIINSLANSLLMRVVFSELTGLHQNDFRKHVRLATVGDDNIHSFSDEIANQFTMAKAQPIYQKLGYTITPASKGEILVDHMPLADLVFVKRRFVLWADGLYRAPIDPDSIYKAFCFEPKGGETTSVDRLKSVFTSGLYEAYLHGEEFFNNFVKEMTVVYDAHHLPYSLITFGELNDIFLSRGLTTAFA